MQLQTFSLSRSSSRFNTSFLILLQKIPCWLYWSTWVWHKTAPREQSGSCAELDHDSQPQGNLPWTRSLEWPWMRVIFGSSVSLNTKIVCKSSLRMTKEKKNGVWTYFSLFLEGCSALSHGLILVLSTLVLQMDLKSLNCSVSYINISTAAMYKSVSCIH